MSRTLNKTECFTQVMVTSCLVSSIWNLIFTINWLHIHSPIKHWNTPSRHVQSNTWVFLLAHSFIFWNRFLIVSINVNSLCLKTTQTSPKLSDLAGILTWMTPGSHMGQRNTPLRQIFTAKAEDWPLFVRVNLPFRCAEKCSNNT